MRPALPFRPDYLHVIFAGFVVLLVGGGAAAVLRQQDVLLLPALGLLGVLALVLRWQWAYYLLFLVLPLAHEYQLPGGLSIDLPSEPLMVLLLGCVPLALLLGPGSLGQLTPREWRHPLLLLPLASLGWAAVSMLFSVEVLKSVKYLLAKTWYLVPFLLGTLVIVRRPAQWWPVAACFVGSLSLLCILYVLPRHAAYGFSFIRAGWAIQPFYRNHVTFATTLALALPVAVALALQARSRVLRGLWWVGAAALLLGLLTSYTRASWLSLPVAGLYYLALRLRLTKALLVAATLGIAGTAVYLVQGDTFMRYAPDFEKTIWHGGNFEAHLESTYKLEDVSGMERLYRWVAAARMGADKPLTGSGPATFYPEYKRYTVSSFRTYVSRNPERSTTHNYFLLQLAEQGVPGLLLFCALVAATLLTAERLYHASAARPEVRRIVLMAALSFVIILFHLFLNELIEVDKIGAMWYVCLALLIRASSWTADSNGLNG